MGDLVEIIPKDGDSSQGNQEQLLQLQKDVLENVALSDDHIGNLTKLCHAAEAMLPNAAASIMLFDSNKQHLNVFVAPSLTDEAISQLNGLTPGPQAGSCGTAMYCKAPVFVENTSTDPRWAAFGQFILDFNAHACWSMPIILPGDIMVGSFALTSFEHRKPTVFQKQLLSICGNLTGIILQRKEMEESLWKMAHYDALTNLPNRALLNERLNHTIETASRQQQKIALFFIDLDNFKNINDHYGHNIGDKVLINASNIMQQCIREQDTLASNGGDEFIILLENISDSLDTSKVAKKILEQLQQHAQPIEAKNLSVTASIGISIYPDDAPTTDELLHNADTAMYQAKRSGRNDYKYYEHSLTEILRDQLQIESDLEIAYSNDEFELYYQPIFTAHDNKIEVLEALIRWNHPKKGQILPDTFISVAEKSDLIDKIGMWVISQACSQGSQWLKEGILFDRISVNLSMRQLINGCSQQIHSVLHKTGFPAKHLELEITENLLVDKADIVISELNKLQDMGISISIADFGTSYSSLQRIRNLPLAKLKIDRRFIADLLNNQDNEILTKMIISMGKSLSLKVVAEGVETEEQKQFLINEGCELLQGYLLCKPLPIDKIQALLTR